MKRWMRRMRKNHKGFTLVELICTIAIFSVIITGVGSAMVISARSYKHGNTELDLQQQAQITANLLTNLIIDSDNVVEANAGVLKVNKNEADGTVITYIVSLVDNQLVYCTDIDATQRLLAEHVTKFVVSQADGDNVDFQLGFEAGGRNYESDYHVTPRNGISSSGEVMSGTVGFYVENRLILEPGQIYDLNVRVTGTSEQGFSVVDSTDKASPETKVERIGDGDFVRITVGTNETGSGTSSSFHFQVIADAVNVIENGDGSTSTVHPTQNVEVLVRRVNSISLNGYKTANRTYKVSANINGTNLAKEPGSWWDVDYVNPYVVRWVWTPNDALFSVNIVEDPVQPYAIVTLNRALQQGESISIDAYAVHPEGEYPAGVWQNKASFDADARKPYAADVKDTWTLNYGGWGRMGTINMGLGPDEWPNFVHEKWREGEFVYDTDLCDYKLTMKAVGAYSDADTDLRYRTFDFEDIGIGTGGFISAELREYPQILNDYQNWTLTLNPHDVANAGSVDEYMSYSSPYLELPVGHTVPSSPDEATNPIDTGRNIRDYNTNNFGFWRDANKYIFEKYMKDLYGNETTTVVEMEIEDVSILYKNTSGASDAWKRDNHVFVTKEDSIDEYTVYFSFDKGWSEDDEEYYFENLDRFVGVIYDDPADLNDVRYDLPVSQSDKTETVNYLTFRLNSRTKDNAYEAAKDHNGIIREIFEYNPYLGYLWTDPNDSSIPLYPQAPGPDGPRATKEQMESIDGCDGTIIFHIIDPNIYGCDSTNKPKVMYCPKQSEIGGSNLYYIDNNTRYHIVSDALAYYQVKEGNRWVTKLTFNWGFDDAAGKEGWKKAD